MKFIFSGYGIEKETIGLYEIKDNNFNRLDYLSIVSPSYIHYNDGILYTYNKSNNVTLQTYEIIDNKFKLIDQFELELTSLTHFTYSKKNQVLIGCSYKEGKFFCVKVLNGKFIKLLELSRQGELNLLSRCHCVFLNNKEDELGIVNIALDKIFFYSINDGNLSYKCEIDLPKESGPRHAVYSSDDDFIYTMTEYSNEVFVIDNKRKELIQSVSTIPHFKTTSYGATLIFSKDEKYLYASNRGEDTIAKFKVLSNKRLEYINSFSCGGKHPRHMILSNDGKYIISYNKDSNNITFIDTITKKIKIDIPFNEPSGVVNIN